MKQDQITTTISIPIPVTIITRNTAKKMLPPSYHPSSRPYEDVKIKKVDETVFKKNHRNKKNRNPKPRPDN